MVQHSRIGEGTVRHRRYVGNHHHFRYKVFMMLVDLSEVDTLFKGRWFWSSRGRNVAAFDRKRYLGDPSQPLLTSVKELVFKQLDIEVDQVSLLTNFVYFGYCFNPISLYFCYHEGQLCACIAEVTNTPWGESHPYVLKPECVNAARQLYRVCFDKVLHVSPFLTMNYRYELSFSCNDQRIIVHIKNMQSEVCHFDATLQLNCLPITGKQLAKTLIKYPFMTGKVILAIYWQALKLWLMGNRYVQKKIRGSNDD